MAGRATAVMGAIIGGGLAALLVLGLMTADRAAVLAEDLGGWCGVPLGGAASGLGWNVLVAAAAIWVVWACMRIRSLPLQGLLLLAALGLVYTGAVVAAQGGGGFPAVLLAATLVMAFIIGQFAGGLVGDPSHQALRDSLEGKLEPKLLERLLRGAAPRAVCRLDVLAVAVDWPQEDTDYPHTIEQAMKAEGAFVRWSDDGRIHAVFGLFPEGAEMPPAAAWAAVARLADALAARPHAWRMASSEGTVERRLLPEDKPLPVIRGALMRGLSAWLDDLAGQDDGGASGMVWVARISGDTVVPGWEPTAPERVPSRMRPSARP